jgi:alpha-glucosidase
VMSTLPWWKTSIIYHCYVRSFMDSDGDGIGDLPGLIGKLDQLNDGTERSLGIGGLWLAPIFPSPGKDFGYDVSDYCAIDPTYGTMTDFDHLADEARSRGIHLIMDLVVNHTSTEHQWFREARASRASPFHDYYIWSDEVQGRPPNNWGSTFGGSAWEWNAPTGEYYLHSFLREQVDLNWRNPEVARAVHGIMRFWMDRGVDGFRLDVANYYVKDALLRDNPHRIVWSQPMPGNPSATLIIPIVQEQRDHTVDQQETHDALKAMRAVVDERPGRMMVGEVTHRNLGQVLSYYGRGEDELHLVFNFFFMVRRFSAQAFRDVVAQTLARLPKDAWPAWVLSNHDVVRAVTRYRLDAPMAKAMNGLLLTLCGTPFLYYGEELGMANAALSRTTLRDPVGLKYWPLPVGRDGERTPMLWDDSPSDGFTSGTPWLPVGTTCGTWASQSADPHSVLSFTRRLSHFRTDHRALHEGRMELSAGWPPAVLSFRRSAPGETLSVAINFASTATPLSMGSEICGHQALFSSEENPAGNALAPWELRICRL